MAVRTITIDMDAYERLSRLKNGGSFSQVIKRYLPAPGATAGDLLDALDAVEVSEETLDKVKSVIEARTSEMVRVPRW